MTIIDTINVIERAPITFPQFLGLIFMSLLISLCAFLFVMAGVCIIEDEDPKVTLTSLISGAVFLPICIYIVTTLIPPYELKTRYVVEINYNVSYLEYSDITDKYKIIDELDVHDQNDGSKKILLIESKESTSKIDLKDYVTKDNNIVPDS